MVLLMKLLNDYLDVACGVNPESKNAIKAYDTFGVLGGKGGGPKLPGP